MNETFQRSCHPGRMYLQMKLSYGYSKGQRSRRTSDCTCKSGLAALGESVIDLAGHYPDSCNVADQWQVSPAIKLSQHGRRPKQIAREFS